MNSSKPERDLWAVVLAGGVGSRFWPVSTPARPKQLLALASKEPLITDTVRRIAPAVPVERVRVLTGDHLVEPIRDAVPELEADSFLIEPRARGTAPALAWAAHTIAQRDPDAIMVSLHADHVIDPASDFVALIRDMAALARTQDRLFTIGVQPDRPETGYGYIHVGERLEADIEVHEVIDFVEKPDRDTASEYLRRGAFVWNSGIFLWKAAFFLDEVRRNTPELAELLPLLEQDRLAEFFERAPNLSVDEGILERSGHVAVARARFRWDDVGAWDAVARTLAADDAGNVLRGEVATVDAHDCIVWSEDGTTILLGARDLVVVRTGDLTVVIPRERTADLKAMLAELPRRLRERD